MLKGSTSFIKGQCSVLQGYSMKCSAVYCVVVQYCAFNYCAHNSHLYGCSRQAGRPVGALIEWEFHSNPLINGLIQHTFKINLLFVENFQVIPLDYTQLFPVDHKSP